MKNSRYSEDENDLTELSLWHGSPKKARHDSPTVTPRQPNISSMEETQILYPNPSSSSMPSTNDIIVTPPQTNIFQSPRLEMRIPQLNGLENNFDVHIPQFNGPQINFTRDIVTLTGNPESSHTNPSSKHNMNPQKAADVGGNLSKPTSSRTRRRPPSKGLAKEKSKIIPTPFPWATNRRAIIHNYKYLIENNIRIITGKVQCKRCEQEFELRVDLEEKMAKLREFIERNDIMHDRAHDAWVNPVLPKCTECGKENSVKPILADKKKAINWLFLLLTQMLCFCTLDQLRYYCKHSENHRTGAKDRLLYTTYMSLLKQFVPEWFD